jgi:hypothetical protein
MWMDPRHMSRGVASVPGRFHEAEETMVYRPLVIKSAHRVFAPGCGNVWGMRSGDHASVSGSDAGFPVFQD